MVFGEAGPAGGPPPAAPADPNQASTLVLPRTEQPGDKIGHYRLLEKLGEGGFGMVYLAEQEEPIRRRVAFKVIKLGMDTTQVIARFEAERQALALMDHPNIARVFDAGTTESGRPFFVMELVPGIKITDYCDQNNSSTAERLRLFMAVCHAIQHAHQKGIIHRDIKPSNILVTVQDGQPVPKVIDFGIAKATGGQLLTQKTLFTGLGQFIGTPAYMSPEQAEMSPLDVDTRTDIYALGVVLYELLTGVTPFEERTLAKAAWDEIRRLIRETEPPKPSTRLETILAESAKHPGESGGPSRRFMLRKEMLRDVRGDLDWIVMKCLEKDRTRRYESASSLAGDLEHHLRDEPVIACPPSRLYQFGKLVRRNKVVFTAASAVAAALVIGLGLSTWLFLRERDARRLQAQLRQEAQNEARRSAQVAQFLKDMLQGVSPSVAQGRDTAMLREILDKTSERVGPDLRDQPAVEAELREIIGEVYRMLGEYDKAEAMLRKTLSLRMELVGKDHVSTADALHNLASVLYDTGRLEEAERTEREALAIYRAAPVRDNSKIAASLNDLANTLDNRGDVAASEQMQREALALKISLYGEQHEDVADSLGNLVITLLRERRLAEAEELANRALAIRRALLGNDHPRVGISLDCLGRVYFAKGDFTACADKHREALALFRRVLPKQHLNTSMSLNNLGTALWMQGDLAGAETFIREALEMQRALVPKGHPTLATDLSNLAGLLALQGKFTEALDMMREALEVQQRLLGKDHPDVAASLDKIATLLERQDNLAGAETHRRDALKILEAKQPNHWSVSNARFRLGANLLDQKKYAEAEPLLVAGYEGMKQREESMPPNARPRIAQAAERLVQLYEATDRPEKAAEWKRKLPANGQPKS